MDRKRITFEDEIRLDLITLHTLVVGSGAAGLNCAEHLHEKGVRDIAVVTDKLGGGTSNNSGSDKQTYYKMSVFGDVPDSPMEFAHALYDGGMMHGDLAYVEALGSLPEFFHLVRNGVPFPRNGYGAFVGYKTDHDPRQRGTSAGPKTSMMMTQKSLASVRRNDTPVMDGLEVIALLTHEQDSETAVIGAVAIERDRVQQDNHGLVLFNAANVVLATGGPGEMYRDSVYPPGQIGNHGLALEKGAVANNLGESQFGLASTSFRWNLSGTYQQVVPCYYSTDENGEDLRYFLNDYFRDMGRLATDVFLKGYQWPFHADRLQGRGSSVIDWAVLNEMWAGRQVYLDFRSNPVATNGLSEFTPDLMEAEAREYLEKSGASQDTPYERLKHMNPPAVEIYEEHRIDLSSEPLPAAVCAQHNNGGLRANTWWESNVRNLFPIGEVCGTHGVRPGGSALNSGQVGGLRAATYIARSNEEPHCPEEFVKLARDQIEEELANVRRYLNADSDAPTNREVRREIQERMSEHASVVRREEAVSQALSEARAQLRRVRKKGIRLSDKRHLNVAFQNEHLCLTHIAFQETIQSYIKRGGGSRGGYMVATDDGELTVDTERGSQCPHRPENEEMRGEILETVLRDDAQFEVYPVEVRPLPEDESWFESVWRDWRAGRM